MSISHTAPVRASSGRLQADAPARGVVVGYEGTRHSLPALERAAAESVQRGLPLTVLTVVSTAVDPERSFHAQGLEATTRWTEATAAAAHAVTTMRGLHQGISASAKVILDTDTARLVHEVRHAGLLVLGTSSRSGPQALLMGSTSREIARLAACPVLVVPETGPTRARRAVTGAPDAGVLSQSVVVGLRRGPESVGLLRLAGAEAMLRGAGLCVAHAYPAVEGEARSRTDIVEQLIAQADLDDGLRITTVMTPEPVADALLRLGSRARLLVVGSRGAIAMARLAQGSVSRAVLDGADGPVLLVPHAVALATAAAAAI